MYFLLPLMQEFTTNRSHKELALPYEARKFCERLVYRKNELKHHDVLMQKKVIIIVTLFKKIICLTCL